MSEGSPLRASQIIRTTDNSLERGKVILRNVENTLNIVNIELDAMQKTQKSLDLFLCGHFYEEPDENTKKQPSQNDGVLQSLQTNVMNTYNPNAHLRNQRYNYKHFQKRNPLQQTNDFQNSNFLLSTRSFLEKLEAPVRKHLQKKENQIQHSTCIPILASLPQSRKHSISENYRPNAPILPNLGGQTQTMENISHFVSKSASTNQKQEILQSLLINNNNNINHNSNHNNENKFDKLRIRTASVSIRENKFQIKKKNIHAKKLSWMFMGGRV